MKKSAIILGASGLTGSYLLEELLNNVNYYKIKVFTRSPLEVIHEKLEIIECDLLKLEEQKEHFKADEVYVCIGTTNSKTPNKKSYREIDFGIPVTTAQLCRENQIDTIAVISSLGANSKSSVFYIKTKGEMEESIIEMEIPNTYLLRPAMIMGPRKERRVGETIGKMIFFMINPLLVGSLKKYRGIHAEVIAKAMINLCGEKPDEKKIIESDKIWKVSESPYQTT
ncbi:MAG: nucleoside-diphosphate sugar epimerase [Flavobacteriales bacterium]|nr:nucleoside-diphosphate sugar epimerase [Flavobacteriales bacterium]|tara:strand:- start:15196 stop:15873 length:678 start_codon:yes stop_codon:yes gene_type:complete